MPLLGQFPRPAARSSGEQPVARSYSSILISAQPNAKSNASYPHPPRDARPGAEPSAEWGDYLETSGEICLEG